MGHSGEGGALLSTNSRGSRSLLKGCNYAKKHPATTPKKHPATTPKKGGYSHNDGFSTETDTKGSPPHNCMRAPRRTELPDKRRNKIRGFASRLDKRK